MLAGVVGCGRSVECICPEFYWSDASPVLDAVNRMSDAGGYKKGRSGERPWVGVKLFRLFENDQLDATVFTRFRFGEAGG